MTGALAWSVAFATATGAPPNAWKAVAPPANEREWTCASQSTTDWTVRTGSHGELLFASDGARHPDVSMAVPGGGRLVGSYRGESVGAVEWVSDSGRERVELLRANAVAFTQYRGDVYIATGQARNDRGEIYRMHRQGATRWQIDKALDLGEAPGAAVAQDSTWTLVTGTGMTQVDLRTLAATRMHTNRQWGQVYPASLVRRQGRWYIGARSAVIRLSPSATAWREEWMVPPACAKPSAGCGCPT